MERGPDWCLHLEMAKWGGGGWCGWGVRGGGGGGGGGAVGKEWTYDLWGKGKGRKYKEDSF